MMPNSTNIMSGIEPSRAPSGRIHFARPIPQGIALTRSALGLVLAALQAAALHA